MKLNEFARELRKTFKFKYLTVYGEFTNYPILQCWTEKPIFMENFWYGGNGKYADFVICFHLNEIECDLDFSEYEDENGKINYRRCIVEV